MPQSQYRGASKRPRLRMQSRSWILSRNAPKHTSLSIWPLEVTNALVKAFRRGHITREELFEYAQRLSELRIAVDQEAAARAFTEVLILAERYQLTRTTPHTSKYLELAKRRNMPIATADGNILQAAAGIDVLEYKADRRREKVIGRVSGTFLRLPTFLALSQR
jgi:predicted nucleic acid-binding protein